MAALVEMLQATSQKVRTFLLRQRIAAPVCSATTLSFFLLADQMERGELRHFDATLTHHVSQFRGQLDRLMLGFTRFGASTALFAVTALISLALARRGRAREARFLAATSLGALILDQLLKLYFQRARPSPPFLVALPTSFSFPSGHALGSTCIYSSLLVLLYVLRVPTLYRTLAVVGALALVMGVGLSRIYLGVHHPSDVVAGQLVGIAWASAVAGYFYPRSVPQARAEISVRADT